MASDNAAPPLSRRELEEKIVARAWKDDEFRRRFVADPKAQFEEHLGTRLPESLKMMVHEESADSLHFVIPQKPASNLDELSDEDLEKVAGGIDIVGLSVTMAVAGIAASLGGTAFSAVLTQKKGGW